jgi:DNA-binding FadR family transcriptional regulator
MTDRAMPADREDMMPPADDHNLSDRVARHLIEYIRDNRLQSGAPLLSEGRISEQLGVSRGIIREAYRSLRSAGILETTNGKAPRVGRLSNRVLTQLVQHALATEQASPEQVLDLRQPIEMRAAELAAGKRSTSDLEALSGALDALRSATSRDESVVADIRFHEIIGQATGNPLFSLVATALHDSLEYSIRVGLASRRSPAELARVVATHAAIVEAIARSSPAEASRRMALHFDEARAAILGRPLQLQGAAELTP